MNMLSSLFFQNIPTVISTLGSRSNKNRNLKREDESIPKGCRNIGGKTLPSIFDGNDLRIYDRDNIKKVYPLQSFLGDEICPSIR